MVSLLAVTGIIARWFAGAALLAGAGPAAESPSAAPLDPDGLSAVYGPAGEARICASGSEDLAVGWCVEEGPAEGVYFLRRRAGRWDDLPAALLPGSGGGRPRDLAMTLDESGNLHAAWSALDAGRRRVFCVGLSPAGEPVHAPRIVNPQDQGEADYPSIVNFPGSGPFIAWQSSRAASFSVETALLGSGGAVITRYSPASGSSQSAMAPQALGASPLMVAWHEIDDASSAIRVSRFNFLSAPGWEAVDLGEAASGRAARQQPGLCLSPGGAPYACWSESGPDGRATIRVARGLGAGAPGLTVEEPAGDCLQPQLQSAGEGWFTLVWRAASEGEQSARLARIAWPAGGAPALGRGLRLSPPERRCAADPSHVSVGAWSAAVWIDDHRDGGSGRVGFAEIIWPPN